MESVQQRFRPAAGRRVSLVNDGALELVFLGVGSAFATTLFQSNIFLIKGGTHVLIDIGSKASIALNEAGIDVLDIERLLVTHSHADHIGGLVHVLREIPVDRVVTNGQEHTTRTYARFLSAIGGCAIMPDYRIKS